VPIQSSIPMAQNNTFQFPSTTEDTRYIALKYGF